MEVEPAGGTTDARAIARSMSEPQSFEVVFDRHFAGVHRYLRRRVGRARADDLAAEVFVVAYERRGSYHASRPDARPWLYGIAVNVLRRHRRSERRQLSAYARTGADPIADVAAEIDLAAVEARADSGPRAAQIASALARLKPRDREALLLFAWAELSYDEIAEALGIAVGTVRSRLNRARRKVREHLSDATQRATAGVGTGPLALKEQGETDG